ncbi:MAG: hypothetical protein H6553_02665 [Chitinophagales bacterium]|nr:hypothetical protein [Chitinophagales bacterium]
MLFKSADRANLIIVAWRKKKLKALLETYKAFRQQVQASNTIEQRIFAEEIPEENNVQEEPTIAVTTKVEEVDKTIPNQAVIEKATRKKLKSKTSIASLLKDANSEILLEEDNSHQVVLNQENLNKLWKDFIDSIRTSAQSSFVSVAERQQPLLENGTIFFKEDNNIALEMLKLQKMELIRFLLHHTTENIIPIEFILEKPDDAEEVKYKRPIDRLEELIQENEHIKSFIKEFELDF